MKGFYTPEFPNIGHLSKLGGAGGMGENFRKDLISKNPDLYEKANKKIQEDKKRETDGLEFIINYIPEIDSNKDNNMTTIEYKTNYKETPRIIDAS